MCMSYALMILLCTPVSVLKGHGLCEKIIIVTTTYTCEMKKKNTEEKDYLCLGKIDVLYKQLELSSVLYRIS